MTTPLWIIASVLIISAFSFAGVFLLALNETSLKKLLHVFVSFAVGAIFAAVFLHLLPEISKDSPDSITPYMLVLAGVIGSLILERFIHWHHCHDIKCTKHKKPVGMLILFGDGMHNFIDGIMIASAYLVDIELGIATTIAVIFHEIPQEIGDFAVLIHSGYTKSKALFMNFLSALASVLGALVVLLIFRQAQGIESILLPIMAGNFLYIAGSDLVPELHRETSLKKSIPQFFALLCGIGVMWGLM